MVKMGNVQLSGDEEAPPYGYSCLNRFPSTRPLRFSSCAGSNFGNFSSRTRFAAGGDGAVAGTMCCQSGGQQMETFKSRDEALTKARYYRERNFELAIHAYSAALDFAPPVFRRSPPPHTDDEQVLYIQLLDPTGFRGSNSEESEELVESGGTQKTEEQCAEDAPGEAACKESKWSEGPCDAIAAEVLDLDSNTSKGRPRVILQDNQDSSSSTAFGTSGCVSRMQSDDFREPQQNGANEIVSHATDICDCAGCEVPGRSGQHDAPEKAHFSRCSNDLPGVSRKESKALAAHHALTAEICDEVAQLYLAAGFKEEALRYYDRAVRLAPRVVEFLYRRGVVLQLIGEDDAAIDSFRKALELDPGYKAAIFNLGICLMRSDIGRKEALHLFHQLTELDPTDDQVLGLMAHCYEADGRYEEALAYRQRVVQLDPQNYRANRELSQLEQLLAMGTHRRATEAGPAESELVGLSGQRHLLGKVA